MHKPELKQLPVSILAVDRRVQRSSLDPRRAAKIAAELNRDALGVITVSRRIDGQHVIVDGQHRVEGLRIAGQGAGTVLCRVFTGLTLAEEAEMFRLLNNTAKVQYLDLFRVRVIEGDPVAVASAEIIERHGWKVSLNGGHDRYFNAVQAFERIYTRSRDKKPNAAEQALVTITTAWGHIGSAVDGRIFEGVGLLYLRYGAAVDTGEFVARLAKFPGGPGALLGKARGLRELIGGQVSHAVAEICVEFYNQRRKTRALPPWRAA